MRMLTQYVLAELVKVFLVSLATLTLMLIIGGVVKEAVDQSLPPAQILWLVPYILPEVLRVTVPVTLLLAVTTVYARMSGSNEVVAIKSLGISPITILWPALILGTLLSLWTVWLNDVAVSWGRTGAKRVVIQAVEEIAYNMLRTQKSYSSSRFSILVKQVDGRKLIRPTLVLHARGNAPRVTITAEEAELRSDRSKNILEIKLRHGSMEAGQVKVLFPDDVYEQEIPLSDASRAEDVSTVPSNLALGVIRREITQQLDKINRCQEELATRAAYEMICGDFDGLASREWETRRGSLAANWARLHRLRAEPHRRWSAGFSCLSFVCIGAPMAIRLRNAGRLTSFFLCFLPILIVYYPLLIVGVDGAKEGMIPPYLVWTGNVLLVGWGISMLTRVLRY